jgi:hypothetical protein
MVVDLVLHVHRSRCDRHEYLQAVDEQDLARGSGGHCEGRDGFAQDLTRDR